MPTELKVLIIGFIIFFILAFTFAMCDTAKKSDEVSEKHYRELLENESKDKK